MKANLLNLQLMSNLFSLNIQEEFYKNKIMHISLIFIE